MRLRDVDCWVFDLDNTLYPASCRLFDQVDRRIGEYVQQLLKLDPVAARALQKQYFRDHRTTLNGLMIHHRIRPEDFLDFVHAIDLSPVAEDRRLDAALDRLPGRKVIYTNGSVRHAENDFLRALFGCAFDRHIEQRNQTFGPFEREALRAQKALLQKLFEDYRIGKLREDAQLFLTRHLQPIFAAFHPVL